MTFDSLYRAIHASPDDDTPRLAFASALYDAGQLDRAEFIRVQLERAALRGSDPERDRDLAGRASTLLRGHELAWSGAPDVASSPFYARGFVYSVKLAPHVDATACAPLFAQNPVHTVRVGSSHILGALPLAGVRTLAIDSPRREHDLVQFLEAGPPLSALASLELMDSPCSVTTCTALATTQRLPSLRSLHLSLVVSHAQAAALLSGPALGALTQLTLRIGDGGRQADAILTVLAAAGWNATLESLRLGARITKAGGRALATGGPYPRLRELSLEGGAPQADGLAALFASHHFPALATLSLRRTEPLASAVRALAKGPLASTLEELDLSDNADVDDDGLAALLAAPRLGRLRKLDLRKTAVTDAGYRAAVDRFGDGVLRS